MYLVVVWSRNQLRTGMWVLWHHRNNVSRDIIAILLSVDERRWLLHICMCTGLYEASSFVFFSVISLVVIFEKCTTCRTSSLDRTYCDATSIQLRLRHRYESLSLTQLVLDSATRSLRSDTPALTLCVCVCVSEWSLHPRQQFPALLRYRCNRPLFSQRLGSNRTTN